MKLTNHLHLVSRLRMSRDAPELPHIPSWGVHGPHYYLFTAAKLTHGSNHKPVRCGSHTVSIFSVDTALDYFTLQWTCERPTSFT
jgi:hypothetical protein